MSTIHGRRISRSETAGGESVELTFDGQDVVLDRFGNGEEIKYLNGARIDNKLRRTIKGEQAQYFLSDQIGSTVALTNADGEIIEQTDYDAFGIQTNTLSTRYGFTGRERDEQTGLMFYRARWYSPELGRFVSEDPIGFKGKDMNWFGYVKNNPVKFIDPKGTHPILWAGLGVGVYEGAVHYYIYNDALSRYKNTDPHGHKKHCYANCVSMRFNLFNPAFPNLFSVGQEVPTLLDGTFNNRFWDEFEESSGDMDANQRGQARSLIFWRSCEELCDDCS
jgi:RHS repeat-associated protein